MFPSFYAGQFAETTNIKADVRDKPDFQKKGLAAEQTRRSGTAYKVLRRL